MFHKSTNLIVTAVPFYFTASDSCASAYLRERLRLHLCLGLLLLGSAYFLLSYEHDSWTKVDPNRVQFSGWQLFTAAHSLYYTAALTGSLFQSPFSNGSCCVKKSRCFADTHR